MRYEIQRTDDTVHYVIANDHLGQGSEPVHSVSKFSSVAKPSGISSLQTTYSLKGNMDSSLRKSFQNVQYLFYAHTLLSVMQVTVQYSCLVC